MTLCILALNVPITTKVVCFSRLLKCLRSLYACADQEGGGAGSLDPPGKLQNIGFLGSSGPDPLKITKLPIQHSILCHHRPASETPFKWRFADGPLMAR